MGVAKEIAEIVRTEGLWGTLQYARHWVGDKYGENKLRIDTSGVSSHAEAGVENPDPNWRSYEAASYSHVRNSILQAGIRPHEDVFLDYGSGRGRPCLIAATYPYRKVIGIEISPALVSDASDNLERARPMLVCQNVEFVCTDATTYELPDDVTVIFLYNTFGGEVFRKVVENIRESARRAPRPLRVIYSFPSWAEDPFGGQEDFRLRKEFDVYSRRCAGRTLARIYDAAASQGIRDAR
jgi:SAM-dependent methyltransferase